MGEESAFSVRMSEYALGTGIWRSGCRKVAERC